jgi:Ca2+-transporting ATPase
MLMMQMSKLQETKWHSLETEEALKMIGSRKEGLTEGEAGERFAKYGPNEIKKEKATPLWKLFIEQFENVLIVLLLIATAFSFLVGEALDAIVILAIVIASSILGFTEEYRAEKAVQLLKKLATPTAVIVRDSKEKTVSSSNIVPGDIIVLHAGDRVPADLRLFEVFNLKIDEASLTGESLPVGKKTDKVSADKIINDRKNMAFSGTVVTYGRGLGVAVATGMNTEFGKIAGIVQAEEKTETPFERRMNAIGKWLVLFMLAICAVVIVLGTVRGVPIFTMILTGISLAVAAVPEALPAVVTGALAIGMYEMAKKRAVVRKLPVVETLGSTSIICSDKTGTMTKGEMTVSRIYLDDKFVDVSGVGYEPKGSFSVEGEPIDSKKSDTLNQLLKVAFLCNDSKLYQESGKYIVTGDTTEGALTVVAAKAGIIESTLKNKRINEIPFTSERKRMTTVHALPETENKLVAMKGALEIVLERCKMIAKEGKALELTAEERKKISAVNERMASEGLRVLALAYKEEEEVPEKLDEKTFETNFVFLGLAGMIDKAREEAKDALRLCKNAGIKVVMITGDHKLTAVAVAKELSLIDEVNNMVLTGAELEKISDEEFDKIVESVKIYARVSPEHKMRIVKALKNKGYVVAMTGDGINDAMALKSSDIGVAMGITGTEVTKEVADMVLADDNFATIVSAIREGRRIFDNIKKYLAYLLQCNIAELGVLLVGTLMAMPLPLTAIQLLWINLTTDGLPALALGVDPPEADLMKRKPRLLKAGVTSRRESLVYFVLIPIVLTIILLLNYTWSLGNESVVEARTQLLTVMIVCELVIALSCRSLRHPIIKAGPLANKFLLIAITISFLMQLLILYNPSMYEPFDIIQPSLQDWSIAAISGAVIFGFVETSKFTHKE